MTESTPNWMPANTMSRKFVATAVVGLTNAVEGGVQRSADQPAGHPASPPGGPH